MENLSPFTTRLQQLSILSDSVLHRAARDPARLGVLSGSRLGRLGDSANPARRRPRAPAARSPRLETRPRSRPAASRLPRATAARAGAPPAVAGGSALPACRKRPHPTRLGFGYSESMVEAPTPPRLLPARPCRRNAAEAVEAPTPPRLLASGDLSRPKDLLQQLLRYHHESCQATRGHRPSRILDCDTSLFPARPAGPARKARDGASTPQSRQCATPRFRVAGDFEPSTALGQSSGADLT